jgi:hypothetical protein
MLDAVTLAVKKKLIGFPRDYVAENAVRSRVGKGDVGGLPFFYGGLRAADDRDSITILSSTLQNR